MRSRDAQDERDVRHQTVADAEHGCPSSAALHVAVVVLAGDGIRRARQTAMGKGERP
jgi:hypothetical protein